MKSCLWRMKCSAAFAALLGFSAACSNPGKSDPSESVPNAEENQSAADANKPIIGTPPDSVSSKIVLSFKSSAGLKNISGYVIGEVDQHGFKATDSAHYAFFTMKPGRYDLIIEAQKPAEDNSADLTSVGIRINGVAVKSGEDTYIKDPLDLLPTFPVKGKVRLLDGSQHEGIAVQIPGSRIKTMTEADGSFTLTAVPPGMHPIAANRSGYLDAGFESRSWTAQTAAALPALTLLPQDQALPTGIYYKGPGLVPNQENIATLFLVRPTGMNMYRISETSDFAAAAWQPYQSSLDLTFPAGPERKVFVQFARDQQQISAIFNADIPMAQP